ncbi:ubiquinone biosynthesis protein COQ9 precursor [Drechmeria coniospora]|uniref:Ubiquinone biosynthesis protein n=1 Tax=Drechmeria coniospora TaxID=98403 RepID=A0A151GUG4_DRECN|nr:ubiquinone biosynthesis protein COQ9 precursor [Drechmeria coniospora]KYK60718.1 ubiquinone biosynthesis protein COQ9 precursor [Drechmeria coniospora]ODA83404.1 hypothetical protein RJ55_01918 [Drechmeria coniospora]
MPPLCSRGIPSPRRVLVAHTYQRAARCSAAGRRFFHSNECPPTETPFGAVEDAILAAAYRHVPEHGFSQRALGLGARDAGFLDISPSVLSYSPFSLIHYHLVTQRRSLASQSRQLFDDAKLQSQAQSTLAVSLDGRLSALTWARLMANKDTIHWWQEALAVMAHPSHLPASLNELARLADEICFLAGDKSTDASWYRKRASLSVVYSTTELFMTNDKSRDFAETRRFLDRRMDEVQTLGGIAGSLGQWTGFTITAAVNVLRSKGAPI